MHRMTFIGLYTAAAVSILLVALAALLHGWILGEELTLPLLPEFPAMVPVTAGCFALLSLALVFCLRSSGKLAAPFLIGIVTTGAAINFVVVMLGGGAAPELMSAAASAGFLIASLCIALMLRGTEAAAEGLTYLGLFGLASSLGVILGTFMDPQVMKSLVLFDGLSVPTAGLFAMFFTAVLLAHPAPRS